MKLLPSLLFCFLAATLLPAGVAVADIKLDTHKPPLSVPSPPKDPVTPPPVTPPADKPAVTTTNEKINKETIINGPTTKQTKTSETIKTETTTTEAAIPAAPSSQQSHTSPVLDPKQKKAAEGGSNEAPKPSLVTFTRNTTGMSFFWAEKGDELSVRIPMQAAQESGGTPVDITHMNPQKTDAWLSDAPPPYKSTPPIAIIPVKKDTPTNMGAPVAGGGLAENGATSRQKAATEPSQPANQGQGAPSEVKTSSSGKHPLPLFKALHADALPGTADHGPALFVHAKAADIPTGDCMFSLRLIAGGKNQDVVLTLKRLPGKLETLPKVMLKQQQFWPFASWNSGATRPPVQLRLSEILRSTSLHGLGFSFLPDDTENTGTGSIECTYASGGKLRPVDGSGASLTVPGGQSVSVNITPTGNFPLRKITGHLRFTSPQMLEVADATYEVKVSTPAWFWIPAIVLTGALLGYFVRIWLKERRKLLQARIKASLVVAALNQALKDIHDSVFREALKQPLANLIGGKKNKDGAAKAAALDPPAGDPGTVDSLTTEASILEAATAAASAALTKASADLEERRKTLQQKWSPLFNYLHYPWALPNPSKQTQGHHGGADTPLKALIAARKKADGLKRTADSSNIQAASKHFEDDMPALMDALTSQCGSWLEQANAYLEALQNSPPPTDTRYGFDLGKDVRNWTSSYGGTPRSIRFADSDAIRDRLNLTEQLFHDAQEIGAQLRHSRKCIVDAALALQAAPGAGAQVDTVAFTTIENTMEEDSDQILVDLQNPDDQAIDAVSERRDVQLENWTKALISVLPAGDAAAADAATITTAISEKRWNDAIKTASDAVAKAPAPAPAGGHPPMKALTASLQARAQLASIPAVPRQARLSPRGEPVFDALFQDLPPLTGLPSERLVLTRADLWAELVQSAVLGLILVGTVYAYYADQWTGNPREVFGLFVAAFSLDLTGDLLATTVKGFGSTVAIGWNVNKLVPKVPV